MDVMELVENEPNARPFQCDWKTCNKVDIHHGNLGKVQATDHVANLYSRASIANQIYRDIIEFIPMSAHTLV